MQRLRPELVQPYQRLVVVHAMCRLYGVRCWCFHVQSFELVELVDSNLWCGHFFNGKWQLSILFGRQFQHERVHLVLPVHCELVRKYRGCQLLQSVCVGHWHWRAGGCVDVCVNDAQLQ